MKQPHQIVCCPDLSMMKQGCEFCGRVGDDYLQVNAEGETFKLCNWACVIAFAAIRAHSLEGQLLSRLQDMEQQLERADRILASNQGGSIGVAATTTQTRQ
jgi:hypothetical protein